MSLNRSTIDGSPLDPPQPPRVQPAYYAGLVINTLVGSSGRASVVELSISNTNVTGYAAFEGGRLARAVFVNLHAWLLSSTGDRPSVHLDLDLNVTFLSVDEAALNPLLPRGELHDWIERVFVRP